MSTDMLTIVRVAVVGWAAWGNEAGFGCAT
jgi:hypothetical protein